jgi:hypothetical protein
VAFRPLIVVLEFEDPIVMIFGRLFENVHSLSKRIYLGENIITSDQLFLAQKF